jgi:hypothetical protein
MANEIHEYFDRKTGILTNVILNLRKRRLMCMLSPLIILLSLSEAKEIKERVYFSKDIVRQVNNFYLIVKCGRRWVRDGTFLVFIIQDFLLSTETSVGAQVTFLVVWCYKAFCRPALVPLGHRWPSRLPDVQGFLLTDGLKWKSKSGTCN